MRIRIRGPRRIRVDDPVDAPIDDNHIWLGVEAEKRRQLAHTIDDLPPVEHQRLVGDLTGDEQVEIAQLERPEGTVHRRHRHPMRARVRRVDVGRGRIVELTIGVGRERVTGGDLAEVDGRLVDRQLAMRRDVADHVNGQALAVDRVHGAGGDPITVCVLQVLVDPVLGGVGQLVEIELPRADLQRRGLVVDRVSIDSDVVERVVGADGLLLLVCVFERRKIPQPKVVDRDLVVLHVGQRQRLVACEVAHGHVRQPVRRAGAGDLTVDVGQLVCLRVRRRESGLDDRGIDLADQQERHPDQRRRDGEPEPSQPDVDEEGPGQNHRGARQERDDRQPGVDIRVGGAPDDVAVVRIQEVVTAEPHPRREHEGEDGEQRRQMRDRRRRQVEVEGLAAPRVHEADQKGGQESESERPVDDRVQERQRQQIEGDVLPEHRVGDAGRPGVLEHRQVLPLGAGPA